MKKLNQQQMEIINGGIIAPGPGEAERCRALGIAFFAMTNQGLDGLSPDDFTCFF